MDNYTIKSPAEGEPGVVGQPNTRGSRWCLAILLLGMWALAAWFLRGDLGKWLDGYIFQMRNPETDTYGWSVLVAGSGEGFSRPLHYFFCRGMQTVLWHHDAAQHFIQAVLHGIAALVLGCTLRSLRVSYAASLAAGLLFFTWPAVFEAVFWPSVASAPWGVMCAMGVWWLTARFAQGGSGWLIVPAIMVLSFMTPCWYEQPATILAGVPLVYLVVSHRDVQWGRRVGRATLATVASGSMCILYVVLLTLFKSATARGGASSFTPLERLPGKLANVASQGWGWLVPLNFWPGAVQEGWSRLTAEPWWAATLGVMILIGVPALFRIFAQWGQRPAHEQGPPSPHNAHGDHGLSRGRLWLVVMLGLAVFIAAWLPIMAIRSQDVASRLVYTPVLGLAVSVAGLLDIAQQLWTRRLRRTAARQAGLLVAAGLLAICVLGAIALVGTQSAFQLRWRADEQEVSSLRKWVPDPAYGTVFMPMRLENWPTKTGSEQFDMFARGVWELESAAGIRIKQVYRRSDVTGVHYHRWLGLDIVSYDDEGVWYNDPYWFGTSDVTLDSRGFRHISWDRLVPFTVGARGRIRLVRTLHICSATDVTNEQRIDLPQVMNVMKLHGAKTRELTVTLPHDDEVLRRIEGWRRMRSNGEPGELARFGPVRAHKREMNAVSMHPEMAALPGMGAISARVPPHEQAVEIRFGVSMNRRSGEGDGVILRVWSPDLPAGANELKRLEIEGGPNTPWTPVHVTLPASEQEITLVIEVLAGAQNNANFDWCSVTQAVMSETDTQ